jgi:hypothetical protein
MSSAEEGMQEDPNRRRPAGRWRRHVHSSQHRPTRTRGRMAKSTHDLLRFDRHSCLSLNSDLTNFGVRKSKNRVKHKDREREQRRQGNLEPLCREEIFKSKLVRSIGETTANLTKIQDYEIEEMKNQDPLDVF